MPHVDTSLGEEWEDDIPATMWTDEAEREVVVVDVDSYKRGEVG
jgi:hypothetical protein